MCTFPSRVFKGKKMPGHMGNTQITVQNLKVIAVREEDHAILVKGAIPGPTGGYVQIRKAIKKA
jgi:large subunit ribosomal protein L3